MHTLDPITRLLALAVLGVVAGAIMISSLQEPRAASGKRTTAPATKELTVAQTGARGQHASAWQTMKSKSEAQIRDNEKRITKFKAQRASASKSFRVTYDKRVAELERRNIALRGKLNDYKGVRR